MMSPSPKKKLILSIVLIAMVFAVIAGGALFFLNYVKDKATSEPTEKVKSTIIEINEEFLQSNAEEEEAIPPSENTAKGGEDT